MVLSLSYSIKMRRLTLSNQSAVHRCPSRAQSLCYHHQIDKKVDRLKKNWDNIDEDQRRIDLNKVHKELTSLLFYLKVNVVNCELER